MKEHEFLILKKDFQIANERERMFEIYKHRVEVQEYITEPDYKEWSGLY